MEPLPDVHGNGAALVVESQRDYLARVARPQPARHVVSPGPSYSRAEQILTWTALVAVIALTIVVAFVALGTLSGLVVAGAYAGATAWCGVTGNLIDHTRTRR